MAKIIIYNTNKDIEDFLRQSNHIESEFSEEAYEDAKLAWEYLVNENKINYDILLEIHRILMQRLRPDIAGKWRTCDVWIGGKRKKFSDLNLLLWEVGTVINAVWRSLHISAKVTKIPFRLAQKAHVLFEEVHPFEDGNGRVGRILYNWHRTKLGLPIHVIHTGREQYEYYEWFRNGV